MKPAPLIACLTAAVLTPPAASAAVVAVRPLNPCYRSGESLGIAGTGYTPSGSVTITSESKPIGVAPVDAFGAFASALRVGLARGEADKTYVATDNRNPAIRATTTLRVSALDVEVHPRSGEPGRTIRVTARGFTTGGRLYAHVVRRGYRRNVRIGSLRGSCHTLSASRRIFSPRARSGVYTVQFDTRRRYTPTTAVRVRFSVHASRTAHRASAASVGARFVRPG